MSKRVTHMLPALALAVALGVPAAPHPVAALEAADTLRFEPAAGSVPRPVAQGGEIHACQAPADFRSHHGRSDRSQ